MVPKSHRANFCEKGENAATGCLGWYSEKIAEVVLQSIIPTLLLVANIILCIAFIYQYRKPLRLILFFLILFLPVIPIHVPSPGCMIEPWYCGGHTEYKPYISFIIKEAKYGLSILRPLDFGSRNYWYYTLPKGMLHFYYVSLVVFGIYLITVLLEFILTRAYYYLSRYVLNRKP